MADNRDDLIEAVRRGRMSPSDAEAEAQRLKLEPLSFQPPLSDYNPMGEPFWTPVMVVAWIVWRTPEAVREAWSEYVAQCWIWRYRKWHSLQDDAIFEGFELDRREPPSLLTLLLVDAYPLPFGREPQTKHINLTEARDEVLDALSAGRMQATGNPLTGSGPRREIPAFEWVDLIFEADAVDDRFTHKRGHEGHGYQHVLLPREEVMRLWKPAPPPTSKELPAVVRPEGAGFMTVFHALLWIATSGGKEAFLPDDVDRWRRAFDLLLPELASGHVVLTGEKNGERAVIAPYVLAACRFAPPFGDMPAGLLHGTDLYLRSYPFIDGEHWRGGFDDALVVGVQERWTRLMVQKEEVGKIWLFGLAAPTRTGAPGRPSSMPFILDEYDRQKQAGADVAELKRVATDLLQWLAATMPTAPRPNVDTIRRAIRAVERERSAEARRGRNQK